MIFLLPDSNIWDLYAICSISVSQVLSEVLNLQVFLLAGFLLDNIHANSRQLFLPGGGGAGNGRSNLTWRLGKCNLGRN